MVKWFIVPPLAIWRNQISRSGGGKVLDTCNPTTGVLFFKGICSALDPEIGSRQGILKGEESLYHWPPVWLDGLVCFTNKNKKCQLSYSWFQTSQTGGQWYSDTSPFSIPVSRVCFQCQPEPRRVGVSW
jgi:hypothetical protein